MAEDKPGLACHKMRDQTGAMVESFLLRPFQTSDPSVSGRFHTKAGASPVESRQALTTSRALSLRRENYRL